MPRKIFEWAVLSVPTTALLLGALSFLGATWPFYVAAAAAYLSGSAIFVRVDKRPLSLAELGFAVAIGVVAFSIVLLLDDRKQSAASQERRTYDFVVYQGETNPDPDSVLDEADAAYEYFDTDTTAWTVGGGGYTVGDRAEVECRVRSAADGSLSSERDWYRLRGGNFMHSEAIKPKPHTGEEAPPICP